MASRCSVAPARLRTLTGAGASRSCRRASRRRGCIVRSTASAWRRRAWRCSSCAPPRQQQAAQSLLLALRSICRRACGRSACRRSAAAVGALHGLAQALRLQVAQPRVQRAQAPQQVIAMRDQQFGRGRRRRRAQVGDEIGEAEVDLVADRGHHWNLRLAAIARATASSLNAHRSSSEPPPRVSSNTSKRPRRGAAQHRRDLRRRGRALHRHRQDLDLEQRKAPRQHAEHVAHRRAAGRGDHANAGARRRAGTLARGVEQAFGGEFRLEFARTRDAARLRRLPRYARAPADIRRAPRTASAAAREHAHAIARGERSHWLLGLNIAQRTCARASFSVKYRCPDDGRDRFPSSPSTQISGNAPSSRSRARVFSWLGVSTSLFGAPAMVGTSSCMQAD